MPRNYQEPAHTRDDAERARLEPLVREDYDRCHPDDSFGDMKRRVPWPFGVDCPRFRRKVRLSAPPQQRAQSR